MQLNAGGDTMDFLYRSRILLLIVAVMLCVTGCSVKRIPYTRNADAPEPSGAAIAHYNWGIQAAQDGNFGQAITELQLAIHNEPGWVMPFFTLGVIYGNLGDLNRAIQLWERATQLDDDFAKAHYNLAAAYSHMAEKAHAIKSLQEAMRIDKAALTTAKTDPAFDKIRNTPEFQELERTATRNHRQE